MNKPTLTKSDKVFAKRLIPYLMNGETLESAMQSLLDRDNELYALTMGKTDIGEQIRDELCRAIYHQLRDETT